MKLVFRAAATLFAAGLFSLLPFDADAAPVRDTADYPADPRPAVVEFFRHIRAGEAEAAWACWNTFVPSEDQRAYEQTQVRNTIAEWIAQFRLEQAVEEKLPELYAKMKANGTLTPTPEQIEQGTFTVFRRLAIVRWGEDEDAALPLALDTGVTPHKWLISLSQYRETTHASVGDSFRATNATALAIQTVTRDVLAGSIKNGDDLLLAQMKHMREELEKLPKSDG